MRPLAFCLVWLLACGLVSPTHASAASNAQIARLAQTVLNEKTIEEGPGAAVLIARGDTVLYRGARGMANVELGVELAPEQVFHIASVTKIFTAAFVLKLTEEGKLTLEDPLSAYLPDFPGGASISIRQLLNHTAGISDRAVLSPDPAFRRRDVDMTTLVNEIGAQPLSFAPGTSQRYSNSGYILLGAVIEKITGHPWHVALSEQLLQPLGLHHTQYGGVLPIIPGRVAGYTKDDASSVLTNSDYISMSVPASAGALASTLDDLHLWIQALSSGQVISAAGLRQMMTPADLPGAPPANPYGFGVYVWQVRGETLIGHTGQIDGFVSFVGFFPSHDIIVIALANDDTFDARTLGRQLAAIAIGRPYPAVVPKVVSAEELRALAGSYQDGNVVRILSVRGGELYAQRGSGNAVPLQLSDSGHLHFVPDELSYFTPIVDDAGMVVRLDYFQNGEAPPRALPRMASSSR